MREITRHGGAEVAERTLGFRNCRFVIFLSIACAFLFAGCNHSTTEREIGYRGKARVDAYLAAGRILEHYGYEVESLPGWRRPGDEVSMLVLPSPVVNVKALVEQLREWVEEGGHLVLLVERSESWHDDWARYDFPTFKESVPEPLAEWLDECGVEVRKREGKKLDAARVRFGEERYEVFAESGHELRVDGGRPRVFGGTSLGEGLLTVLTDARPFRNRYIDEHEHAALLVALAEHSPYEGSVVFIRNATLSFWSMLWKHGWTALLGLAAVTVFWLWKNMPRFGPRAGENEAPEARAYEHHLEALGGFHWRLDKAAGLLRPLRESLLERAQAQASAAGHRDGDLFEWMAVRAGITRERAERAMIHERPSDPATFTRLLSDLQTLHLSLP